MIREGRLGKEMDPDVARYISSLEFDRHILLYDILNDLAHVVMLVETGILEKKDGSKILRGLREILSRGEAVLAQGYEDVHLAIEGELTKRLGDVAGKMHTARSRNDQVACDLRMWLRDEINKLSSALLMLQSVILDKASVHADAIMPGYTHLQRAQPVTLGHHLIAHYDSFSRDLERLNAAYGRINLCPLGAGALAATSFPIDRERTAELLGFDGLVENSMDAVSARDFFLEAQASLCIVTAHASRVAEEIILWSSAEFGFVELSAEHAGTSSIMPQKKNPDALELIRAKSARVAGGYVASLAVVKALPMSYNRDLQELSPLMLDSIEIASDSIAVLAKTIKGLAVDRERMLDACSKGFVTATDLADLLVKKKGLPFRRAHGFVGSIVAEAAKQGKELADIDLQFVEGIAKRVLGEPLGLNGVELRDALDPTKAVRARNVVGGPSPRKVSGMIASRRLALKEIERMLRKRTKHIEDSKKRLLGLAAKLAR